MALLARLVFLGLASAEVSRLESWHDISGAASAGAGGTVVVPYVEVVPGAGRAEVPPNASVAIGSAGGATVNGTGASRFFVVRGELALSNLTLVDGYNGSYGGGVAVGRAGTLVLRNVSMSGCVSAFGGAVYALGALYVAGGTFSRNVAARSTPEVDGTGGFGDVFYAAGPTHVDGSNFLDNGVDDGLGYGWDQWNAAVDPAGEGVAIWNAAASGAFVASRCTLRSTGAGARMNAAATVSETGKTLILSSGGFLNVQRNDDGVLLSGIDARGLDADAVVAVSGCAGGYAEYNSTYAGNFLYLGTHALWNGDAPSLHLEGLEIVGNYGFTSGGIVSIWEDDKQARSLRVVDSAFRGNLGSFGGAIAISDVGTTAAEVVGCVFEGNNAYRELAFYGGGGAIWHGGTSPAALNVTRSTLAGNSAAMMGGAIYSIGELRVESSTCIYNVAAGDGGCIATASLALERWDFVNDIMEGFNYAGVVTVVDSTFAGNAALFGGAVSVDDGELSVLRCVFEANDPAEGEHGEPTLQLPLWQ